MSSISVAQALEWDTSSWARCLSFWQQQSRRGLGGARVMEVGARNGGLSLWASHQGAREVFCTDLHGPTDDALEVLGGAGCEVRTGRFDLLDPTPVGTFDIVIVKSVLGGVGKSADHADQRRAIATLAGLLEADGEVWVAENVAASRLHRLGRRVNDWQHWSYLERNELEQLFERQFGQCSFLSSGLVATFGRTEGQRRLLARLDRVGEGFVPSDWRYLLSGVASGPNSEA